ncbi:MAG: ABC transporter permease [Armatimonadetes bacterium]|nr:ABC transporter permease [Armatimonadota bacterium]
MIWRSAILSVAWKEAREMRRDPYFLGLSVVLPITMFFLFSHAVTLDVRDMPLAVYDRSRSQTARRYIDRFVSSGYFRLVAHVDDVGALNRMLGTGQAKVAFVIPQDFSRNLHNNRPAEVQILVDGSFPTTAQVIVGYIDAINASASQAVLVRYLERQGQRSSQLAIEPAVRVWYDPALKSMNYIVPGLYGVILLAFAPLLTALGVVRERESGSIHQIFVSPVRPYQFILGKTIPYCALMFAVTLVLLAVGIYGFRVPMRGNLLLFVALLAVYTVCTVGVGLLFSTLTRSQLGAILLALLGAMMPAFYFSGFLYPVEQLPAFVRYNCYLFPAYYFNRISRDIVLKGMGLQQIWPDVLIIMAYTSLLLVGASLRLKKKV